MNKIVPYLKLMRLDRPVGFFLTGWPTLWAVWLAGNYRPSLRIIIIFILGILVMRAAGCVMNDIADRNFDPHVARTKNRPLANQAVKLWQAILLFIILILLALCLVLQLNQFCFWIAVVTALLTLFYPFCKRFTSVPQLILGLVFNAGILIAFAAQQNNLPPLAWILYLSTLLWTIAYDTMYALTDMHDDQKLGLKSTAILFGQHAQLIISLLQILFLSGLFIIGLMISAKGFYWFCWLVALGLSVYQQYLLRSKQPFKAFVNNQWLGLTIFLGIIF